MSGRGGDVGRYSEVGAVTVRHEYRVCGPSPYGGLWDHGWRREPRARALGHAATMTQPGRPARVEHRIVETAVLDTCDVVASGEIAPDTRSGRGAAVGDALAASEAFEAFRVQGAQQASAAFAALGAWARTHRALAADPGALLALRDSALGRADGAGALAEFAAPQRPGRAARAAPNATA